MTLSNIIAVSWGPPYLFFFGYFYRGLRGNTGTTKGILFGGMIALLSMLFNCINQFGDIDGVELWGTFIRTVATFVFTGLMMDWTTLQFSWRQVRRSYDSPAITTLIAVFGTVLTTIVTATATGTLNRLLEIAFQGISAAFGDTGPRTP